MKMLQRVGWLVVASFVAVQVADAQGDKNIVVPTVVRPIKFAPKDVSVAFTLGGKGKVWTLADPASVEKLVGKQNAPALLAAVDFKKEAIVVVSWFSSGPPDGVLKHETKAGKLQFYVQGPPRGVARGERARIGLDFFAIPRTVTATFDPKER